jgi:hypothetical protein
MKSVTPQLCEEFLKNPTINPITGRRIEKGKVTYNKLMKACQKKSPSSTKTLMPSPKSYKIPEMGPMIHWIYNANDMNERRKNMSEFLKFIQAKVKVYEGNQDVLSRMQIEEFKEILEDALGLFSHDRRYSGGIMGLLTKVKNLLATRTFIDDRPKYNIISDIEIKPSRRFIRGRILEIYSYYNSDKKIMIEEMNSDDVQFRASKFRVTKGRIRDICETKQYLDYVIQHKIFTYDDIYKNTFPNESIFEELKELHKEYAKVYKRVKGKSP